MKDGGKERGKEIYTWREERSEEEIKRKGRKEKERGGR